MAASWCCPAGDGPEEGGLAGADAVPDGEAPADGVLLGVLVGVLLGRVRDGAVAT